VPFPIEIDTIQAVVGRNHPPARPSALRAAPAASTDKGPNIMGQVIVDPEELRRFAARLRFFSTEVMTQMQGVQRQLAALSSSWRDQEQQKFTEEFEQQLSTFARFVEATEDYVPFLIRKAERVEQYQQQR
jgi:uncharacterized protein YukE